MEKERRKVLNETAKSLNLDYVKALEKIALCNFHKNKWYKTMVADYNTDWFCLQTACDFFDFTKPGLEAFFSEMEISEDSKILDVGAGVGLSTEYIARKCKSNKVIYNNIKGKQAEVANNFLKSKNIQKCLCDVEKIKEKVDVIFAFEFFEHFENPCKVFNKLMKSTGAKVIVMQNSFGGYGYGHFVKYKIDRRVVNNKLAKFKFNDYLRSKGYKVKEIKNSRVFMVGK